MEQAGKAIMYGGLGLALVGAIVWAVGRAFPGFRPGRLPGDIVVERPGVGFYFPVTTMILLSVGVTLILWIVSLVRK